MERLVNTIAREVTDHWHNATPTDFGALALAIVVLGWFFTRFYND